MAQLLELASAYRASGRREEGEEGAGGPRVRVPAPSALKGWDGVRASIFGPGEVEMVSVPLPDEPPRCFSDGEVQQLAGAEAAPPANRGVEITTSGTTGGVGFSVHWLTLTVFEPASLVVPWLMADLPGVGFDDDEADVFADSGSTKSYGRLLVGPDGLRVCCEPRMAGMPAHVSISLSGSTCEAWGLARIQRLLVKLGESGWRWHCTRVDLAWDGSEVSPERFMAAVVAGNVRTRVKLKSMRNGEEVSGWEWRSNALGQTATLGNRHSSLLRVYNRRGFNRVELEAHATRARQVADLLSLSPLEQWSTVGMGFLRSFVDVVDRAADSNISRCPLLGWWSDFISGAERAKLSFAKIVKNAAESVVSKVRLVQLKLRRVARQVAAIGAEAVEALPGIVEREARRLSAAVQARRRELLQAVEYVRVQTGKPYLSQIFDSEEGAIEAMLSVS